MGFAGEEVDHADDDEEGDHAGQAENAEDGDGVAANHGVVAAAVDAHLFERNMTEDLNFGWQPTAITGTADYSQAAVGIKLNLNF